MIYSFLIVLLIFSAILLIFSSLNFSSGGNLSKTDTIFRGKKARAVELITKLETVADRYTPKFYIKYSSGMIERSSMEDKITPQRLVLIQLILALAAMIPLLCCGIFGVLNSTLLAISTGLAVPILILGSMARARQDKIVAAIPFFADLLTLSCEAGMDIFASLLNIVQNSPRGPLLENLEWIIKEIRMGKSRHQALKEAYRKTSIWDLKTIYLTILQSETLGTPLGKSLRNQVEIMRNARMNKAEKLSQEAPLKLMIPLMIFIFPTTFLVLVAPIAIRLMNGEFF